MARKRRRRTRPRRKRFFKIRPKIKRRLRQARFILGIIFAVFLVYFLHQHGFFKIPERPSHRLPLEKKVTRPFVKAKVKKPLWKLRARKLTPDKPKIAFVIDDIGNTRRHKEILNKLGRHVTYAILPMLRHSRHFNHLSEITGAEIILHLPLEARDGTIPGPGLITDRMPDSQILDVLNRDLLSVPHHVGVSNHMGSQGAKDPKMMGIILQDLKKRGLFYLDSYTTSQTVSLQIGKELGLPVLTRSVFLDIVDTKSAIRRQIKILRERSQRQGYAIGIGHYRYNTLKVLQEEIPFLIQQGFEIISLSDLVAHLHKK